MKLSISIISTAVLSFASVAAMAGAVDSADGVFTVATGDGDNDFVRTEFVYALSADVLAGGAQNTVKFVAAARHPKGRFTYGADSEGGSVRACEAAPVSAGFSSEPSPDLTPLDPAADPATPTGACAGTGA